MTTYWIMDYVRNARIGPYTNKKVAAKVRTQALADSIKWLGFPSNFGVKDEACLDSWYMKYPAYKDLAAAHVAYIARLPEAGRATLPEAGRNVRS